MIILTIFVYNLCMFRAYLNICETKSCAVADSSSRYFWLRFSDFGSGFQRDMRLGACFATQHDFMGMSDHTCKVSDH